MKNLALILPLFSMMFWNVENCFDNVDGGFSASDTEFSSTGTRHWTKERLETKIDGIGKTILWAGAPDVVGLAEVENKRVLYRLCNGDLLRKTGYRFVHYESRDPRGIDVALLYRPDRMELVNSRPVPVVTEAGDTLATRDILYVCLLDRRDGELWHILVNHHPSKYGGRSSEGRRAAAMLSLKHCVDSVVRNGNGKARSNGDGIRNGSGTLSGKWNIIAAGDFNDTPDAEAFSITDGLLVNLGAELLQRKAHRHVAEPADTCTKRRNPTGHTDRGETGTIRYRGKWELIDNFLVSPGVADRKRMEILRPAFLLERDRAFPGDKPRRTYVGPRYNGGISDHLPIML